MMSSMFIAFFAKMLMIICALVTIKVSLALLDRAIGFNFKEWINGLEHTDPKALALYFGLRFVGITILAGLVLG